MIDDSGEIRPTEAEIRTDYPIDFGSNSIFEDILTKIQNAHPNWHTLITDIQGETIRSPGHFAELHLYQLLQQAQAEYGSELINLTPIQDGEETDKYLFRTDTHTGLNQVYVYSKETGQRIREYDAITKIGDLLVVWESKITRKRDRLTDEMKPGQVSNQFEPLLGLFPGQTRFGYAILTTPEAISSTSEIQENFIRAGGKIAIIPEMYDNLIKDGLSAKKLSGHRLTRAERGKLRNP